MPSGKKPLYSIAVVREVMGICVEGPPPRTQKFRQQSPINTTVGAERSCRKTVTSVTRPVLDGGGIVSIRLIDTGLDISQIAVHCGKRAFK